MELEFHLLPKLNKVLWIIKLRLRFQGKLRNVNGGGGMCFVLFQPILILIFLVNLKE
jgi:hypothetical protein